VRVLDLFSGIGGFSLGLERAGFRTVAFCEIDPYCRAVLARHWPGVPIHEDICGLTAEVLADSTSAGLQTERTASAQQSENADFRGIDLICGGFPCQDISFAGKGAGLAGARSGRWREYHRLIRELRPRYVIVENVSALLGRGLGEVLGDLAALGYDAEWHCIPASYVGAPHRRDRVWVVSYPNGDSKPALALNDEVAGSETPVAYAGYTYGPSRRAELQRGCAPSTDREASRFAGRSCDSSREWWLSEPNVGRVAHGVPARVDRLRALGNAVVPQVVEIIGRAIMRAEA